MKLPTLVVLLGLFCFSCGQEPKEYTDVTGSVSSSQAQYTYPPEVVTIKGEVYNVYVKRKHSFMSDKAQLLISPAGSSREKTCDLSVPLDSMTGVKIDKVVALGNGKLVIATNRQRSSGKYYVYHIIIDPSDCSSERTVKFPYPKDGGNVLALVPYHDSYDIFYSYYSDDSASLPKNPHRYNDRGQRQELDYSLETNPDNSQKFMIDTIKPFDASEGYYYSYFDKNSDEMVLQRLDSRYQKVKELRLKDSPDVSTKQGHMNYCSVNTDNPSCKLLNADLEVKATTNLPKLSFPSEGRVDEKKVINLPNNKGLVVFIAYKHDSRYFNSSPVLYDFYLQWVSSDGSKVETKKIGSSTLQRKTDYKIVDSKKDFCHVAMSIDFGERDDDVTAYNRCLDL